MTGNLLDLLGLTGNRETKPIENRRIRVYVAGPYTKPDPCVNTRTAILAAEPLWQAGLIPFVPHLTHLWHTVSPHPYQDWLDYDIEWMLVCDAVLRLPGESSGADKEVALAIERGIPVFFSQEDLLAWAR